MLQTVFLSVQKEVPCSVLTAPLQKCSIVYVPFPPYAGCAGTERNAESVVFCKWMV